MTVLNFFRFGTMSCFFLKSVHLPHVDKLFLSEEFFFVDCSGIAVMRRDYFSTQIQILETTQNTWSLQKKKIKNLRTGL